MGRGRDQTRFPDVWNANYARKDVEAPGLSARDVEAELLPALARAGAEVEHIVTFHAEAHVGLLAELSTRGHRIAWTW